MSERTEYVYSVKFLCGTVPLRPFFSADPLPPGKEPPVKPANYTTTINVHNPHERGDLAFRKKAVLTSYVGAQGTMPEPQQRFKPGPVQTVSLATDAALAIDPRDIVKLLGDTMPKDAQFIEGFVVIYTPAVLDVVAVYTSQPSVVGRVAPQTSPAVSIDVEYIEAKTVARV